MLNRSYAVILGLLMASGAYADTRKIVDCAGADLKVDVESVTNTGNSGLFSTVYGLVGGEWRILSSAKVTASSDSSSKSTEYNAVDSGVGEYFLSVGPASGGKATGVFKGSIPKSGMGSLDRTLSCRVSR